jgi:dipeptidyl aminopeptidase/acylaminoacyl peptidase
VINVDGSNQTQLTHSGDVKAAPAWSPDSSRIAFLASSGGRFELGMMDADGGNERAFLPAGLASIGDVAWSPDGTQLAMTGTDAQTGSEYQVWIAAQDGSAARQVSHFPTGSGGLTWRPIPIGSLPVCPFGVGDTIRRGGVGAAVPPPGRGVVGTADGIAKSSTIQIETSLDGVVTIEPGNERCRLPESP